MYYKLIRHVRRQLFLCERTRSRNPIVNKKSATMNTSVETTPRHRLGDPLKTRPEQFDVERPYSQLRTVKHGDRGCFAKPENRSMCLPPPLVQPYIINCRPAPSRKIQDILGAYVIKKGVVPRGVFAESKRPGMRAPQPRVAKDPRNKHPVPPYKGRRYMRIKFA